MSVSVSNAVEIYDPIVAAEEATTDAITAQTEAIEALAACQAQAQVNIAQTQLCMGPSAEDVEPTPEPCCRTETLVDTPEPGDTTERISCNDGSVTDTITYANGDVCTEIVSGASPRSEIVAYDVNGNLCTTDVPNACDPNIPTDYFIPKASDFGNQIFCIPGYTYAFAWSGVTAKNLKEELERFDLNELNDINLPAGGGDSIRAEVDGVPYMCDQGPLHPLQETQANQLDGCYAEMGMLCEKGEDPIIESPEGGDPFSFPDFLPRLDDCSTDDLIAGKTAQEAYYTLWADWWCCEKRSKQMQQYIYWAQLPLALYGLITGINTYNEILDKNLDMICATQEDLDLIARCSAEILGTEDEPGLLKICQSNLLEGHNDRIGLINNRGQHACELADDELDCYDKLWKPLQEDCTPVMSAQLKTMLENGRDTSEYTTSWASGLEDCITENMLPELKREFAPLLSSVNCVSNNINDWRQELKDKAASLHDHFNQTYKCKEKNMIPTIMDMTTCMVQRTCELRDWLYDCAREDQDIYQQGYQKGEINQARAAMSTSAQLIPKIIESVGWLDKNVPYALDIFKTCYGEGQGKFNPRIYAEASDLAPEITRCFAFFRDNATDYKKFFEECYQDAECRLVKQQLDFACQLAIRHKESLERLEQWSINDREMFTRNFQTKEIRALQEAADRGTDATRELTQLSSWFDERTKEFHDTYHQHWLPCDIDNLKRHCDIWTRGDPLQGIERNNTQMSELSYELQDFHSDGLVKAKTYMDEVFKTADEFDYCVEGPAVAHVRNQIDTALDELEKCTSKYARGHLLAAQQQLKVDGARAIGGAAESAQRWKWFANEQLTQRDFDRKVALMGLLDAAAIRAIEANKTETAGYDLLLTHSRDALVRGQLYMQSMHEAGSRTSAIDQNQVDSMLRSVQLMHFWPELALRENGEFNQQYSQMMDDAQGILQMGHSWRDAASREKTSATQVMGQSFDVANRLTQLGQFYFSQAESMNTQRAQIANQAGQLGNQYANTGHNLHKVAADKVGNALQQSINSAQMGLGAGDLGHKHEALALEIENKMTLNALEHLKAGISSFAVGLDFLQEVRQSYQLSGSYGINASNTLLNMMKHGQNAGLMGLTANEQCYQMTYEMLCKAKDFLQKNHQLNLSALHGDNTVASTNNLLQQQGQSVSSAFSLLGNSLQGITQNSSPQPFPAGNGVFGFNGGAF
jgi:hypothetical protein